MRRTIITIVSLIAALVLGGFVGVALFGGDHGSDQPAASATQNPSSSSATDQPGKNPASDPTTDPTSEPTTAVPTRNPVLPTAATGSLTEGRKKVLLGGKLTIPNTPTVWEETSSDADSATFADKSNCSTGCPKIWFYDTTKGQNHVTFGDDPIAAWAKDVCHGQGTDLQADFTSGGASGVHHWLSCDGQDYYGWWIGSEKVFVSTQGSDGQISDPKIVEAVLESVVWNR